VQSDTFAKVCAAVAAGQVHVSEHAYDEAVDDGLSVVDLLDATPSGEVIEAPVALYSSPCISPTQPAGPMTSGSGGVGHDGRSVALRALRLE
jgi:hypothetical protein